VRFNWQMILIVGHCRMQDQDNNRHLTRCRGLASPEQHQRGQLHVYLVILVIEPDSQTNLSDVSSLSR
jgi:hypothetical protein